MRVLLVALVLLLSGCNSPSSGKGNEPTYSGNGKGNHDAEVIEQCAWLAYEQLKAYPETNGDAVFVLCLDENGVWAI